MARLSNEDIRSKSVKDLEEYSSDHPKEAGRIAKQLGISSMTCARIAADNLVRSIFPVQFSSLPDHNA